MGENMPCVSYGLFSLYVLLLPFFYVAYILFSFAWFLRAFFVIHTHHLYLYIHLRTTCYDTVAKYHLIHGTQTLKL
jgi:hypothetical protein